MLTVQTVQAAEATKAVFFKVSGDALEAVEPREGEWFCEYEWDTDYEGDDFTRDGALVEYVGLSEKHILEGDRFVTYPSHRVVPEGDDCDREPGSLVLVRQS